MASPQNYFKPFKNYINRPFSRWLWWGALLLIWLLSTWFDRAWLSNDQRLPSWDQAEYLSSALEHGRGLGLLPPSEWNGWHALLDLSPKIPPLSALISGSLMAFIGEAADKASWVLSLWHGLLLIVVAVWGRVLGGSRLGLLAAVTLVLSPAMAEHRVEFSLDLAVATSSILSLWLLFLWQRDSPEGGTWSQAIAAAFSIGVALLIKQSALLVLAMPSFWAAWQAFSSKKRRSQTIAGISLVASMLLPWLHHNWITTIGGTQRAVLISGAEEGDPGILNLQSWIWYPKLMPNQLGVLVLTLGVAGLGLLAWKNKTQLIKGPKHTLQNLPEGWLWLIGVTISGWICITLSPNKDDRYIAPVIPLIILILAKGWLILGDLMNQKVGKNNSLIILFSFLTIATGQGVWQRWSDIDKKPGSPAIDVLNSLNKRAKGLPTTVLLTSSDRNLNEQTLSYLGQIDGRNIQARRLGRNPGQEDMALAQSNWWILATGDQGTSRKSAKKLGHRVRKDPRFQLVESWDWTEDREVELWKRKDSAEIPTSFDNRFISLARGLESGPANLEPIFKEIEVQHLLDPDFRYQNRVESWALKKLEENHQNQNALWSLALLGVLQNRPEKAAMWFTQLEALDEQKNWARAYHLVILLADWKSCHAAWIADNYLKESEGTEKINLLIALRDLSRTTCFDPRGPIGLKSTLIPTIKSVENQINGVKD